MKKAAVAFFLAALSCVIIAGAICFYRGADIPLLVSNIEIESAVQNGDNVEIKFSLNKRGYYFSDYEVEIGKDEIEKEKTVYYITFYASLGGGYEADDEGNYVIKLNDVEEGALAIKQRDAVANSKILTLEWGGSAVETSED